MSAHTPGPWSVLNHEGVHVLAYGALTVASVTYQLPDKHGETTRLANARLIAAAPDLLDALRDLDSRLRDCFAIPGVADAYDSAYQESVAEAIVKATGAA